MYCEGDIRLINEILLHGLATDNSNACIKACVNLLDSWYIRTHDVPPATKVKQYVPIDETVPVPSSSSRRSRSVTANFTAYD